LALISAPIDALLIEKVSIQIRQFQSNHLEKLRRLLDDGIQHSPRGILDSTPLLQATQNGQQETIGLLLELGASILEQDRYQRPALHFISAGGHAEAADELLLHGGTPLPRTATWLRALSTDSSAA
jgi:ankyrin repeat protein